MFNNRFYRFGVGIIFASLIFTGCGGDTDEPTDNPSTAPVVSEDVSLETSEYDDRMAQARDFMSRGDYDQAYDILFNIAESAPTELLRLMAEVRLCAPLTAIGKQEEAQHKLQGCISRLHKLTEGAYPPIDYVILLAEAYASQPDMDSAVTILNNAKAKYTEPENEQRITTTASRLYMESIRDLSSEKENDFKSALNRSSLALSYDPANKSAQYEFLKRFVFAKLDQNQQDWLSDTAVDGEFPSGVRIAIGLRDGLRGNLESTKRNFSIAGQSNPKVGQIISELTEYMIRSRKIGDEKMADLVDVTIFLFPDVPYTKRARGTLNMFTKNYQDAANDFRDFIENSPEEFCIWSRRLMAEAYRKMGDPDAADLAERRIEKLINKLSLNEQEYAEQILAKVNKVVQTQFN